MIKHCPRFSVSRLVLKVRARSRPELRGSALIGVRRSHGSHITLKTRSRADIHQVRGFRESLVFTVWHDYQSEVVLSITPSTDSTPHSILCRANYESPPRARIQLKQVSEVWAGEGSCGSMQMILQEACRRLAGHPSEWYQR